MVDADFERYRDNLQGEVDGASVYATLAESEPDPNLAEVFRRLAAVERAHGEFWRSRMGPAADGLTMRPSARARLFGRLARLFGPSFVLPALAASETSGSAVYDDQPDARAMGLPAEERSHARLLRAAAGDAGLSGSSVALLEGRHHGGGNSLRAAILGANDGLVSNLSLVMGVAGADRGDGTLLLTGLAGLAAGAASMAMGEWLSVTSSREFYRNQIAIEAQELREIPDEEREELFLIYRAKGISEPQARKLADRLLANPHAALDTLVREELGVDPRNLGGSAWSAAGSSFLLFTAGAIIPVVPFMLMSGRAALFGSLVASGLALALVGAGTSLFTGRSPLLSAGRQLLIGMTAAIMTYGLGVLFGVSVG